MVENVISTQNISKSFRKIQALKSVNLAVPKNSIFGFLGPNGAGKTTLMKILLGLSKPTSGSGTIFGYDIVKESVSIRERIGYLPQQPRFIEHMTARENLHLAARFFFNGPERSIRARCDEVLELVGLEEKAERPIRGFSGGEKQRLGIALAQVNYPDLLILDEPASALDPLGRQDVLDILARLRKYSTIFYSTHILDDVQRVSDHVGILNHGQLVASGTIEQILSGKDGLVYTMMVKGNQELMAERLSELPWVTHTASTHNHGITTWHINVSNEAAAEADLLWHIIQERQLTVIEFSRKQYELEEVFIDIVKGENNGSKP